MPKLTKRIIDAVEPQATEFFLWDEGIPGFGLRVMPSGRKSFVVQFRAGRRARRMSLGPSTVLTCDQARTRAIAHVGRMNGSSRPTADVRLPRRAAPSFIEPAVRYRCSIFAGAIRLVRTKLTGIPTLFIWLLLGQQGLTTIVILVLYFSAMCCKPLCDLSRQIRNSLNVDPTDHGPNRTRPAIDRS